MNIFFKKLMLKKYKLSELESKVFDYMIEHQEEIVANTLSQFAEKIFVSTATVSRTCKKLGFNGFSEFQYAYNDFKKTNEESVEKYSGTNEYLNKIVQDLNDSVDSFREEKIRKIVKQLIASDLVELFGIGRTYSVCREGATKLTFAGRIASARSDWDEQHSAAKYLSENDLALLVSVSGETQEIIQCAEILKKNKVKTIGIIGANHTTLQLLADYSIILNITPAYINQIDMSSHFLISILFDSIAIAYMEETLGDNYRIENAN